MDKYLIKVTKGSSIQFVHQSFPTEEAMNKFIKLKTDAGFICHKYDYDKSFSLGSVLSETTIKQ
jgi:hypothetical protein